jgi:hypothetical protein
VIGGEQQMAGTEIMVGDFEQWLKLGLAGKSLAGRVSAQTGRVIFLFRNEQQVSRCEVYLGRDRVEVRGARAGTEAGAQLFVRTRVSDWLEYMKRPTPENARSVELFGTASLLSTLAELLELRQGHVAIRIGANAERDRQGPAKRRRRN